MTIYSHGGGISGFVGQTYSIPSRRLYVAVLSNVISRTSDRGVAGIAQQIISIMMGSDEEQVSVKAIELSAIDLHELAGTYRLPDGSDRTIAEQNGSLFYVVSAQKKVQLVAETRLKFTAGKGSTFHFVKDESGKVTGFELFTGRGRPVVGRKLVKEGQPLQLEQLDVYCGTYHILNEGQEQVRQVVLEGTSLFYVVDDSRRIPLRPESRTRFFLYPSATSVDFVFNQDGNVDSLVVRTGSGRVMPGKKISTK